MYAAGIRKKRHHPLGKLGLLCTLLAGLAVLWPAQAGAQNPELPEGPHIVICEIVTDINSGVAVVVERAIEEAAEADAILFIVDTPGGRVDSAIDITNAILEAEMPTIAYVRGMGAISAGALISYACDHIVMAPGTNIGASTPVMMGAEGAASAVDEKSMSFIRARYRALGEEKGHNPLLGEAMVDEDIAIYGAPLEDGSYAIYKLQEGAPIEAITARSRASGEETEDESEEQDIVDSIFEPFEEQAPGSMDELKDAVRQVVNSEDAEDADTETTADTPVVLPENLELPENAELISETGKLLTLTSLEAQRYGLVEHVLSSEEAVIEEFGYGDHEQHRIDMRWDEALFAFLTNPLISSLLVLAAMGGIYIEVRTPGFGVPGMIGFTALALLFGANLVVGMASWVDLLLVLVGIGLIVVELFVLPGFGFIGISGVVLLLAGVYLGLTRVPVPEYTWDYERMYDAVLTISLGMFWFMGFVMLSSYFLPKSPLFRALVLADSQQQAQGYMVQTEEKERVRVGMRGVATSSLRPAGRGRFEGKTYDIMTRGEFLDKGAPLVIIRVEGNRLVVAEDKH